MHTNSNIYPRILQKALTQQLGHTISFVNTPIWLKAGSAISSLLTRLISITKPVGSIMRKGLAEQKVATTIPQPIRNRKKNQEMYLLTLTQHFYCGIM